MALRSLPARTAVGSGVPASRSASAGQEPTGPSAWDGYAATVITAATVEALESGRVVTTDLKPRPAFYGGAA
jgi:hypothetical protein